MSSAAGVIIIMIMVLLLASQLVNKQQARVLWAHSFVFLNNMEWQHLETAMIGDLIYKTCRKIFGSGSCTPRQ